MNDAARPARPAQLGVWDAVSIIVGIVVGVGIYETPPFILRQVPGPWSALGVWALGGLLSLVGALCYAELASTYPHSGGDYVYLSRAYAPWVGFLFGWAQVAVILTANIGMMAFVFADYAARLWDWAPGTGWVCAAAVVAGLSLLNLLGVVFGKGAQNLLNVVKVLGLAGILAAGLLAPHPATSVAPPAAPAADFNAIAMAMVLVFISYGGWSDAAYVAAEVRDARQNIPRALILGTLAITAIYLLTNAAYLWGLGFEGARESRAVASDVVGRAWGPGAARAISLLVLVSALGSANGLILSGSRVTSVLGAEHPVFAWLGRRGRTGTPWGALVAQALIAIGMILVVGTPMGRAAVDAVLAAAGLRTAPWDGRGGFETLLRCTAPVFWFFFLLSALSLFVLRARDRGVKRPFAVPLYPLLPLIFCATCAYMLYAGIQYADKLGLIGGGLLLLGLPLYAVSRRLAAAPAPEPA